VKRIKATLFFFFFFFFFVSGFVLFLDFLTFDTPGASESPLVTGSTSFYHYVAL